MLPPKKVSPNPDSSEGNHNISNESYKTLGEGAHHLVISGEEHGHK